MSHLYHLSHSGNPVKLEVNLPGSKSMSNRALALQLLSGNKLTIHNLSDAEDTVVMKKAIERKGKNLELKDAGTAMRFLMAAFCALNKNRVLSGSPSLCARPVGRLVDALRQAGFKINCLRQENYPPVEVIPVESHSIRKKVSLKADESSQYVSALLMAAPLMPEGLEISLAGTPASWPFVELTISMMEQCGVPVERKKNTLMVRQQPYKPVELTIEADWTGAVYWYMIAALAAHAEIKLKGLNAHSKQGDRVITEWMIPFGVKTVWEGSFAVLHKMESAPPANLEMDFNHHPDLAQAFLVLAAAKNISLKATGLRNLRIKETDRLHALRVELQKTGATLELLNQDSALLKPALHFTLPRIETYNDHRMAMSFAPLALLGNIHISDPLVVKKSYPEFWNQLREAGFSF